ncbi:hypothetical protein IAT38_007075 [Cryptococcus sp. DSM 104549]
MPPKKPQAPPKQPKAGPSRVTAPPRPDPASDEDARDLSSGDDGDDDDEYKISDDDEPEEEDDDDDEDMYVEDEDVDMELDGPAETLQSILDQPDTASAASSPNGGFNKAQKGKKRAPRRSGGSSLVADGSVKQHQSDIFLIDNKYRQHMKDYAGKMEMGYDPTGGLAKIAAEKQRTQDRDRGREDPLLARSVPFSTRLGGDPMMGAASPDVVWQEEPAHKRLGKKEQRQWQKAIASGIPWDTWRGEGWWPEMYLGGVEGENGDAKRDAWLMKDQIRLGLDDVGRVMRKDLVLLSEAEAASYLPTQRNKDGNPWIDCYLGPRGEQTLHRLKIFYSQPISETNANVPRPGYTFYAGGPIWGLDWCPMPQDKSEALNGVQYLAVSTIPHIDVRPAMFDRCPADTKAAIQIWSMVSPDRPAMEVGDDDATRQKRGMKCEMVLCVQGGSALQLKWMPLGAWDDYDLSSSHDATKPIPKLGMIAAVQLDGSVSIHAVPHPRFVDTGNGDGEGPIYVKLGDPQLRLNIPDATCMCMDWVSGSRLAVGLSNGHVAVWDVLDALQDGEVDDLLPSVYTTVCLSAIASICAGRIPPSESNLGGDPVFVVVGSYDGTTVIVDLRDVLHPTEIVTRIRLPVMALAWSPQFSLPLYCDIDYTVQAIRLNKRTRGAGRSYLLSSHRGQIWQIATSDYHQGLLTAGADGALILSDVNDGIYKKYSNIRYVNMEKLYEVDYNQHTGEYRISDDFLPEPTTLEAAISRRPVSKSKSGDNEPSPLLIKTAAWSPHVGLHRVCWNVNGLGVAGWVASGGAAGLGRVEWVEGRWKNGDSLVKYKEEMNGGA